jgi:hypothetical protein
MNGRMKGILAVVLAGVWVNASEFFRNMVLLNSYWVSHYKSLGMIFPAEPVNGMIWGVWGFLYAWSIYLTSRRFSLVETALLSWLVGFVLMWLVIFNLNVLPRGLLLFAVPLSLLEAFVGALICKKAGPEQGG